ncbi:SLC13 family permease [Microbispora sp. H10836]|uniref:SLC13 family permease n=1 Tax=Microbispora sp. H10836 TaxID=2729106 RepID=UPI002892D7E4|nr:SLC13 family permease [Microbispora sp. H10836]
MATGLLPAASARDSIERIAPLLLFLGAVIVLAELTKEAQVFDVIATRIAIVGRGSYAVLFLFCTAFASLVTIFLNLDTTAVLLTPVPRTSRASRSSPRPTTRSCCRCSRAPTWAR